MTQKERHFRVAVEAIIGLLLGLGPLAVVAFWPEEPVVGPPVTIDATGRGTVVTTVTGLTPLKSMYPVGLMFQSLDDLRATGMSREELLKHVELTASYDESRTFLRIPKSRQHESDEHNPFLRVAYLQNPMSATVVIRMELDADAKWPAGMMAVIKGDSLTHLDRLSKRESHVQWLIVGVLYGVILLVGLPLWLWGRHRRKERAKPQAATTKVSREDSERLRKELENPRR